MQTVEHMGSNTTIYDLRFLAHIILEAETPIVIGSGRKTMLTDSEILKDYNGLPYIPGTSIAGVIRHALPVDLGNKFFGLKDDKNNKGSEIVFSEAKLLNGSGLVIDRLCDTVDNFSKRFKNLPKRNHVRISHRGVAEDHGKFDEEVIYKGCRFCFEIEMVARSSEKEYASNTFDQVLTEIQKDTFRIGGGTRVGFGKMHPVSIKKRSFDLKKKEELSSYLATNSSLEKDYSGWEDFKNNSIKDQNWIKYSLTLKPMDFFSFGSGKGDNDVDTVPVKESYVKWDGYNGFFVENALLIPASSLKGALAHRVAYYYNLKHRIYAMQIPVEEFENYTGSNNPAVRMLFGCQKEGEGETVQKRGIAIFNDIFADYPGDKILNHVAIDRFTGGAMDGALYSEKVVDGKGELTFHTEVLIEKLPAIDNNDIDAQTIYKDAIEAFEKALGDIDKGLLPLGGGNGRGHGIFKCKFTSKD
mgnify:CR=1 FL=1